MRSDEDRLLSRRQLDHPVLIVGLQRCEDPAVDSKVRVPHVRALDNAVKGQRHPAKSGDRHTVLRRLEP